MVIWTEPAKADLRSIHDFIAHDSKHYAKKVIQGASGDLKVPQNWRSESGELFSSNFLKLSF